MSLIRRDVAIHLPEAWALAYCRIKDYIGAARYGNALGALRTQGKTFAVFKSLEETDKIIKETYF